MPDEKPPLDRALEMFVYAPVGMALYVRDMFPSMMGLFVSRGKREVKTHLGGAEVPTPPIPQMPPLPVPDVTDFARRVSDSIGVARGVAEGGLGLARDVTGSALQGFLSWRGAVQEPADGDLAPSDRPTVAEFTAPTTAAAADRFVAESAPDVESLPIPDYDELSASQVIERLEGLDTETLDAIRAYESSHRGRNTILGKIAQLR